MFWEIAICFMVLLIPVLMYLQYRRLSRIYYFQKSITFLKDIKHSTVLCLFDRTFSNSISPEEAKEMREFISATDAAIEHLNLNASTIPASTIKKKYFNKLLSIQTTSRRYSIRLGGSKSVPFFPFSKRQH